MQVRTHCNGRGETYKERWISLNNVEGDVELNFHRPVCILWLERDFDCKYRWLFVVVVPKELRFLADVGIRPLFHIGNLHRFVESILSNDAGTRIWINNGLRPVLAWICFGGIECRFCSICTTRWSRAYASMVATASTFSVPSTIIIVFVVRRWRYFIPRITFIEL